jgi:hypothetical protein
MWTSIRLSEDVSVLVRQLTDGLRVFTQVDINGDAPRLE